MARGVKKAKAATLTPEEKLAQALVPVEAQPYPVPGNWCWVYLPSLCEYMRAGGDKPQNMSNVKTEEYQIPVVANGLQEDGIIGYTNIENEKAGTVTVSGRGTIGHSVLRDYSYYPVIRLIVLSPNKVILSAYLKYVFDHFEEEGTGTSIPQLTVPSLRNKTIPLPPLTEQQRIVDRIESLFAKLDEAKEKAQAVVDGFEDRKAAILHKAFTGELIGLSGSNITPLETIVESIRIGPFGSALHKEDYVSGGVPVVNPKHISNQAIMPENSVTITEAKANELSNYRLLAGDIIMGRRGEMGRSAPVTEKEQGWLCGTGSLIIRLQTGYDSSFYSQIIASQSSVQFLEENCVGSTMKNLNEKVVRKLPVPRYTKEEQVKIVAILSRTLMKEQQAKEAAEQTLAQIETMKKAILVRAFRGELGTNDPTDESAEKLLKRLL